MTSAEQPTINVGDRVRIVEREPGNPDIKSLTYYPFYQNLVGSVIKTYEDGSVTLNIERNSLPEDIRVRHETCESGMRDKWLDGLGEEEREKLSEKHKRFTLKYTLLVSSADLEPAPKR